MSPPLFVTPDWPPIPGVRALTTMRRGGTSTGPLSSLNFGTAVGDAQGALTQNRHRLAAAADLPSEPRWLRQVHGTVVADLDALPQPESADAAFTRLPGVVCALLTADCLPVLIARKDGAAVAAAHAGWRGLAAGVIEATLEALDTPAEDLYAWLGPAIGPAHFEVGGEVRETFLASDPDAEIGFLENPRGRWQCDLYALARRRLQKYGVADVFGGEHCTFSEPDRFYSHRRDAGGSGRMATLIWRSL